MKIPKGVELFIDTVVTNRDFHYVIRMAKPGQSHDYSCPTVGPTFTSIVEADKYRDYLLGKSDYRYPSGAV